VGQSNSTDDYTGPLPDVLQGLSPTEHFGVQVPLDLALVESDGRPVTLAECFDGKLPVILTLNYSNCPMLCSLQLNGLFEGLTKLDYDLGTKYRMITVSIDPEEPPARAEATKQKYLAAYGRPGGERGWHCLVGREAEIRRLADTVGFAYVAVPDTRPKQYAHAAVTVFLTPEGKVSRYLNGIEFMPKDLRLALLEAGEGKIGTPVEQVLLFCYAYDPRSGSYVLSAVRIMQASAVGILLVLGGVLAVFWRREWKRSHGRAKKGAGP
jgi:protein SCO1/2